MQASDPQRPEPRHLVEELEHFQNPFIADDEDASKLAPDRAAQRVALAYLDRYGQQLGVSSENVNHLRETLDSHEPSDQTGVQFKWGGSRLVRGGESIVWWLQQTHAVESNGARRVALDVLGAGVRMVVLRGPLRIVAATSTAMLDIAVSHEFTDLVLKPRSRQESLLILAGLLAIPHDDIVVEHFETALYRTDRRDRRDVVSRAPVDGPMPFVESPEPEWGGSGTIEDGVIVPVLTAQAAIADRYGHPMAYRIFFGPQGIVYLKALAASVSGEVFPRDPKTQQGSTARPPSSYSDQLDVYRSSVPLLDLFPPGGPNGQVLAGRFVAVQAGPGGTPGPNHSSTGVFDSASRTDGFSAVNAYRQCDDKFRMMEDFGFPATELFPANFGRPGVSGVAVWTRAAVHGCGNGNCINAQVVQGGTPYAIGQIRFALADLSDTVNRLGLAADDRFVWHEFCHALLIGATNHLEFRFCHSAGDALGAISCDPGSALVAEGHWRGSSFPWVQGPLRRHDRKAEHGWAWFGQLYNPATYPDATDPSGYRAEQILSSTLFRLYRAIGGDAVSSSGAPDVPRRQAASDYAVYLIVRAIADLATAAVPTGSAKIFASRLMEADVGTNTFQHPPGSGPLRLGGAVYKVIRWAFEKQGLYYPAGALWPRNAAGDPPPVDVYIEDAAQRHGEYAFTDDWQASGTALWLRNAPDGKPRNQAPKRNKRSFVYVRVSNRGTTTATAAGADVFVPNGAAAIEWTQAGWTPLPLATGGTGHAAIPPGQSQVFGPFEWKPTADPVAILAAARDPADLANIAVPALPCAAGPIRLADLVPFDNNLGFRSFQGP